MARRRRHDRRRLRSRRRLLRRCRGSWRTHRRLGHHRGWRWSSLRGLHRGNDRRLGNYRSCRSRRYRLGLNGAWRRRRRPARHGHHGRGWRRDHLGGRRRSCRSGLQARRTGGRFLCRFIRNRLLFGCYFGVGQRAKMIAHSYRGLYFNRARMGLFLGNAGLGQIVNDGLCLDLELASQFVNSDLVRICHCPPGRLLFFLLV